MSALRLTKVPFGETLYVPSSEVWLITSPATCSSSGFCKFGTFLQTKSSIAGTSAFVLEDRYFLRSAIVDVYTSFGQKSFLLIYIVWTIFHTAACSGSSMASG